MLDFEAMLNFNVAQLSHTYESYIRGFKLNTLLLKT